jgi:hypothetical protein
MEDDKQNKNMEENPIGEPFTTSVNDCNVFQPVWIRRNSVLSSLFDRRFMEVQYRLVWYLGSIFWIIFLISKIF